MKPSAYMPKISLPPTASPVEVSIPPYGVYIAESQHERNFTMEPMENDYIKIYFILDGITDLHIRDTVVELSPGSVFVVPPGYEHYLKDREDSSTPLSLYIIALDASSFPRTSYFKKQMNQLMEKARKELRPLAKHEYLAYDLPVLLRRMLYEQELKTSGYETALQGLAQYLSVAVTRAYSYVPTVQDDLEKNKSIKTIHEVARFIDNNFYKQLSLPMVTKMSGLSTRHFSNCFKETYGVSFIKYVHYKRVKHAQHLLAFTNRRIMSICFECGFTDQTHFYRIFKRHTGMSPRRYRNMARKARPEDLPSLELK